MSEPLVLLPGMMCDARLFDPQMTVLGSGRALHIPPVGQADTVQAIVADILEHAPPRFALAGLSLGGIIAMEVIARAPERVTRLALMATNAAPEHPKVSEGREPQIKRIMAGGLIDVMRDEMKPNYLAPGPGRAGVLDLVLNMAVAQGEGVFIRQSRALQTRPDQRDALRGVAVPTLILCGAHDTLCPIHRHELMAELIPHAQLQVIEDAGHLLTLETPDKVTAAMQTWLEAELPPLRLT